MNLNISVKRKFTINGKEYNSIEEMPAETREAFEKMMVSRVGSGLQAIPEALRASQPGKIVFNGIEYKSVDAMPQDVRQLYETALKAVETGAAPAASHGARLSIGIKRESGTSGAAYPPGVRPPIKVEISFSPWSLIVCVIVGALVLVLYCLWKGR